MTDKAIVVGISGPSSSGKTTLARLLQSVFSNSTSTTAPIPGLTQTFIIHEDDFYLPDNEIPYKTTITGKTIQDWDCAEAYNIPLLRSTLSHLRSTGELPPGLRSIQDLNEKTDSGVSPAVVESLREYVISRLSTTSGGTPKPLALLEGILLFAPTQDTQHTLHPVQETLDARLFLPTAYEDVKRRREARTGYVTSGDGSEDENFWVDPPGYVDDVVWPNYALSHSWLLLPDGTGSGVGQEREDKGEDAVRVLGEIGDGTTVRVDAGVSVPGKGWAMEEVLKWAVEEVLRVLS